MIGEVCHFVDTMHFLTGSNIVRVYAERISGSNKTAKHRLDVSTYPHYKHLQNKILPSRKMSLKEIITEILNTLSKKMKLLAQNYSNGNLEMLEVPMITSTNGLLVVTKASLVSVGTEENY